MEISKMHIDFGKTRGIETTCTWKYPKCIQTFSGKTRGRETFEEAKIQINIENFLVKPPVRRTGDLGSNPG